MKEKRFQATWAARLFCIIVYVSSIVLVQSHLPFNIPDRFKDIVIPCYVLLGAVWLTDMCSRRIVLRSDSIQIVSLLTLQMRTVPRSDIDSVTWERPGAVLMKLRDGAWLRLPRVGNNPQGLANTIRSWLKRTDTGA
jgi:hypothetical protein